MRELNNWFLWRLVWDATEQKYDKKPCDLQGNVSKNVHPSKPEHRHSYADAIAALALLHKGAPPRSPTTYTLGFWMTEGCGYWFFDLDNAVQNGTLVPKAQELWALFPGALWEWSSSGRGMHIIGRGEAPPHRTKPTKEAKAGLGQLELEFYTKGRGIAFGFDPWQGDANTTHDAAVAWLCSAYFPPPVAGEGSDVRRPEWRGPEDDDALIARFLRARQSAASAFGGRASLQDLWAGNAPEGNESDMALASHLAFWTGCDGDRMERLMRRSGLARAKWDTHKTYLRELTIKNACASCTSVYVERQEDLPMPDAPVDVEAFLKTVRGTETYAEIIGSRIPEAQAMALHPLEVERVARVLIQRMKELGGGYQLPALRSLLTPKVAAAPVNLEAPDWASRHCFVRNGDFVFDVDRAQKMSVNGFNNTYFEKMPFKQNGRREVPFEWAVERWGMRSVDDSLYNPPAGEYFHWAGKDYVNLFNANTMPLPAPIVEAQAAIDQFRTHLWLLCGQREDVYWSLLKWIAYNIQYPGRKIKWMPLIVGVPGDGKSIISDVIRAAIGDANVRVTSINTLKANGGFTDWAHGKAVNFIEEIYMVGEQRFELYESMKNFIELGVININPKGKVTFDIPNVTNHMANSNHRDAMPLRHDDRRVMVIFSPFADADEAARARGLQDRTELPDYIARIGDSCRAYPGQWRSWLAGIDLADFKPYGRAPVTEERSRMVAASKNDVEELVEEILDAGGPGISRKAFSSAMVQSAVRTKAQFSGVSIPNSSAWAYMLSRMGFSKISTPLKWKGQTHRIWISAGISENSEKIREILDATCNL